MTTFLELLEYDASQLEKLTDEELLKYLGPCLEACPPIDIKIVEEEENKIKNEKLAKKLVEKEAKKAEKEKEKEAKRAEKLAAKADVVKAVKVKKTTAMVDMAKALQEQLSKMTKEANERPTN